MFSKRYFGCRCDYLYTSTITWEICVANFTGILLSRGYIPKYLWVSLRLLVYKHKKSQNNHHLALLLFSRFPFNVHQYSKIRYANFSYVTRKSIKLNKLIYYFYTFARFIDSWNISFVRLAKKQCRKGECVWKMQQKDY